MEDKVIFINGFTQDETVAIMRAVKAVIADPGGTAFSMGTPTNRDWVIKDLIKEVREEHEYMKKNAKPKTD
ncbi:MAG TPA: DUF3783 domain-containing protein [Spirochaeta sp.]|nr:DUF3783 domain-containing protein [Spirochaeta sp.]